MSVVTQFLHVDDQFEDVVGEEQKIPQIKSFIEFLELEMNGHQTQNSFNTCSWECLKNTRYPKSYSLLHFSKDIKRVIEGGLVVIP